MHTVNNKLKIFPKDNRGNYGFETGSSLGLLLLSAREERRL